MLVVLGLIILMTAVIVGVAGVVGNAGSEHALTSPTGSRCSAIT